MCVRFVAVQSSIVSHPQTLKALECCIANMCSVLGTWALVVCKGMGMFLAGMYVSLFRLVLVINQQKPVSVQLFSLLVACSFMQYTFFWPSRTEHKSELSTTEIRYMRQSGVGRCAQHKTSEFPSRNASTPLQCDALAVAGGWSISRLTA